MTGHQDTEFQPGELPPLKFDANGLIPAVVQEATTHAVLMVAWMNRESLELTLKTGYTVFWSRSRRRFAAWRRCMIGSPRPARRGLEATPGIEPG